MNDIQVTKDRSTRRKNLTTLHEDTSAGAKLISKTESSSISSSSRSSSLSPAAFPLLEACPLAAAPDPELVLDGSDPSSWQ